MISAPRARSGTVCVRAAPPRPCKELLASIRQKKIQEGAWILFVFIFGGKNQRFVPAPPSRPARPVGAAQVQRESLLFREGVQPIV